MPSRSRRSPLPILALSLWAILGVAPRDAGGAPARNPMSPGPTRVPAVEAVRARLDQFGEWRARAAEAQAFGPGPAPASEPGTRIDAWIGDGVPVTDASVAQGLPGIASDGANGAYVAWIDVRIGTPFGFAYVYANRLDGNGDFPAGWSGIGTRVSTRDSIQIEPKIAADGSGGAFVAFTEFYLGQTAFQDVYVQRLQSNGSLGAGWPATAKKLDVGEHYGYTIQADGTGGLLVGWAEISGGARILRLDGSGNPASGWPAAGLALPGSNPDLADFTADGTGGFYYLWASNDSLLCVRYAANSAVASGWSADGVPLAASVGFFVGDAAVTRLSNGDAMAFWTDFRNVDLDLFAVRVAANGTFPAPWALNGIPVCTATGTLTEPHAVPDLSGGAIVAWQDDRVASNIAIYAQRVTSGAGIAGGWTADGVAMCGATDTKTPGAIVADGASGILAGWSDDLATLDDFDVYAQRVLADGSRPLGFPAAGVVVCNAPDTQGSVLEMATDGANGAILAWEDDRNAATQVYAARLLGTGVVAAHASLVDATAAPGLIRLHWFSPDGLRFAARLEREVSGAGFTRVADLRADASGHVRYEDRDVEAGARYRYRLIVEDNGSRRVFGEVALQVPDGLAFAIEAARPNPTAGPLTLTFTLPAGDSAWLELFDVGGRRVWARDVGAGTAGRHVLRLDEDLAPGVYQVRLTQRGESARGRVVVTE